MKKNLMYIILAFVFCLTIGVCIYKSMLEEMGSKYSRQSLESERAASYIGCVKKNIWKREGWKDTCGAIEVVFENIRKNDFETRRAVLGECVESFLQMDLNVEEFVAHGGLDENYILYCRDLLLEMYECGINENDRARTFYSMMEKYKLFCVQQMPDGYKNDRQKILSFCGALGHLRGLLRSNLSRVETELFTIYLVGLSIEKQIEVKRWFAEFLKNVRQEIERSEKLSMDDMKSIQPSWNLSPSLR